MSDKKPCIRISIPTYVSYTLGMTFRNTFMKEDPRIREFLKMKMKEEPSIQDVKITNVMDLISEGALDPEFSESDDDEDD
jgi:hypothetical protein